MLKERLQDVIRENDGNSNRWDKKIRWVVTDYNGRLSEGKTSTMLQSDNNKYKITMDQFVKKMGIDEYY